MTPFWKYWTVALAMIIAGNALIGNKTVAAIIAFAAAAILVVRAVWNPNE